MILVTGGPECIGAHWRPADRFRTGLRKAVYWYLERRAWVAGVADGNDRVPAQEAGPV